MGLLSDSMSEGINLQGSSVIINLTQPSTIRKAEQRAGRVDRMDTPHESISVYYPERDELSSNIPPHLKERWNLVNDVLGSNIKLPDGFNDVEQVRDKNELNYTNLELNEQMFRDREGLFDAFYDVRNLIDEEQGLISKVDYEEMRTSKARVLSYVGLVKSNKPWCFLVIQTNKLGTSMGLS